MKKVKIGFWFLVLAFLMLLGYQNKEFFQQKQSFNLNLYVFEPYTSPELYNGVTFVASFMAGLIIAGLFALLASMRARKTIKQLNKDLEDQRSQIETTCSELNAFKSTALPPADKPIAGDDETAEATKTFS